MMLHRHFEREKEQNITTLKDVSTTEKQPEEKPKEETKKRGRPRKTEE